MSGHANSPEVCREALEALERCGGNQTRAAESLGLKRTTYLSRLQDAKIWQAGLSREAPPPAHVQYEPQAPPESAPQIPLTVKLKERLKRGACSLADLTAVTHLGENATLGIIADLEAAGFNIRKFGDMWTMGGVQETTGAVGSDLEFVSTKDNKFLFGCISDNHLCSKYERLDVGEDLYSRFAKAGITRVYNSGNWIDGEAPFNKFDLKVHGLEPQLRYLAKHYPQREGITTYAVAGEDHEGFLGRREAIDVGRFAERIMKECGRDDWRHLGFMECFVPLVNANSGARSQMLVMHPGGGSAYATSYRPQKIVESFEGGEKPAVLLLGHYHKLSVNLVRNVWALQCGCAQDQTVFMRKKNIDAHIGGIICELEQDERTGAIIGCKTEIIRYFNQSYYNDRWSVSDNPVMPERKAGRG